MKFLLVTPEADVPSGGHLYNQHVAALTGCAVAPLERAVFQRVNVVDSLYLGAGGLPDDFVWLLHWLPAGHDVTRARGVIVTSEFMAAKVRALGVRNVAVCEPGLEDRYFVQPRRARSGRHVLTVANFEERKGLLSLLESLAHVDAPWSWEIIGDMTRDPAHTRCFVARVEELCLRERVVLRGSQSPDFVFDAYGRADVFAMLPTYEPYGMVFAEAVARGVPVVASAVGALPRIVGAGGYVGGDAAENIARAFKERPTRVADFPRWADTVARFTAALERWFS